MRSPRTRLLVRTFAIELVLFMILTFLLVSWLLDRDPGQTFWEREGVIVWTTLGVIAGPMTGTIAREGQCLDFSLGLLPACGAILAAGIAVQFLPRPTEPILAFLQTAAWALGWLGWFGGGIVSLGYALE